MGVISASSCEGTLKYRSELTRQESMVLTDWNYDYYLTIKDELKEKYPDKYAVIKNREVFGIYDTWQDGYDAIIRVAPLGSFIIQDCNHTPVTIY